MKIILAVYLITIYVLPSFSQTKDSFPYKIENIRAYLFYNQNATFGENVACAFSPNIIDNDSLFLFNTSIGEGDAQGCSEQTFVIVEISGNPKDYVTRKIRFKATESEKVILERLDEFAIFSDNKQYFISYILHNTGCGEVKITATISDKKEESRMEKTILYGCGE